VLAARDIAFGVVCGQSLGVDQLPDVPAASTPLTSLEDAIRPALLRPPCFVSFSGGRDSAVVLAVAVRAARREGLALPVPLTAEFPWAPATEETAWQELVVQHLELPEWERSVSDPDELDLLGPISRRCLLAHGLLYPHNKHFHAPLLERARGGSLLTGIDGDGLFGSWPWGRAVKVMAARAVPQPRDILRVGNALAPRALRRWAWRRRHVARDTPPWLTPPAQHAWARAMSEHTERPLRWSDHVEAYARRRSLAERVASLALLAGDADALVVHPLLDRRFLAAVKRDGGTLGWGDRTGAMLALFGDLLPHSVLSRTTKASFSEVTWSEPSREFAREWDGQGVDADLVDAAALQAEWRTRWPDVRSGLLLQSAWLHANGGATAGAGAPADAAAP
jgi:asparagine synthase (glutamine-hydrolysing)